MSENAENWAKLRSMLAAYDYAAMRGTETPNGVLERLYIADDIVSQAGADLLDHIAALEAENARMREIVAAVAKMDPLSDEARVISGVPGWSKHANLIAKARALLASDGNDTPREPPPA